MGTLLSVAMIISTTITFFIESTAQHLKSCCDIARLCPGLLFLTLPPVPPSVRRPPTRPQATNIVKQKLQVSGPYGESKYAPSRPAPLTNANNGVVARRSAQLDQLRAPAPYGSIPPVRFYAKPPVAPSARPLLPSIEISRRNVERPVGSAVTHEHEPRSNLASGRLAQAMQAEINARPVRHPVRQGTSSCQKVSATLSMKWVTNLLLHFPRRRLGPIPIFHHPHCLQV